MELRKYKNITRFLVTLFNFFKENEIGSSLQPVEDYDILLERILESKFLNFHYNPGIYSIDFRLRKKVEKSEVYMLIFGEGSSDKSAHLLIDLGERDLTSFISFSIHGEKHPPFLMDFVDEHGKLKIEYTDGSAEEQNPDGFDIMTFEEFALFLAEYNRQKKIKWIEVD